MSASTATQRAEIYFSVIGTPDEISEVQQALDGAAGWLRKEMAPTLRLRNIPALAFIYPHCSMGRIESCCTN